MKLTAIIAILASGLVEVLVSVAVLTAVNPSAKVPNAKNVVRVAVGVAPVPVPVRVMMCDPPDSLSLMVMVSVRVPVACGLKVAVKVQLCPMVRVAGQLFDIAKSLRLPVGTMLPITSTASGSVAVLVITEVFAVLVMPMATLLKLTVAGTAETMGVGTTPVPVRLTD